MKDRIIDCLKNGITVSFNPLNIEGVRKIELRLTYFGNDGLKVQNNKSLYPAEFQEEQIASDTIFKLHSAIRQHIYLDQE